MAKASSSALARKTAVGSRHHAGTSHLRAPGLPPIRRFKPALTPEAREILDRMRAEEEFYPDVDETLLILGY